jgi:hypothetical protein
MFLYYSDAQQKSEREFVGYTSSRVTLDTKLQLSGGLLTSSPNQSSNIVSHQITAPIRHEWKIVFSMLASHEVTSSP